jgi:hypothetical protein
MRPIRLCYFSRNKLDLAQGALADRVSVILAKSVANNRKADISGGVIFCREWFAQVLEGDRVAVAETFARIERDPQHDDVTVIESRAIHGRRFGFWWMAAAGWSPENAAVFSDYCGKPTFDPRRLDGEHMCNLIAAVLENQMQKPSAGNEPHWLTAWRAPKQPVKAEPLYRLDVA